MRILGDGWFNKLKAKFLAFDIKPAKPIIPSLFEQAYLASEKPDLGESIAFLQQILQISPHNHQALIELSEKYFAIGNFKLARRLLLQGIRYYPQDFRFYQILGQLYAYTGKVKPSVRAYEKALTLNPELVNVSHLLNGVQGVNTAIAPRKYIVDLFNDYAGFFDNSLVEHLDYRGHIELASFLHEMQIHNLAINSVLDLGCGTGLLGKELVQRFKLSSIDGVDLSANMLEKSMQREIYTSLHAMDAIEYLQTNTNTYDVIGCSDVLVYIGDVNPLLQHAFQRLNTGGCFACTIEKLDAGDYKLAYNGRYKHSLSYITSLSQQLGFNKIYSKAIDLRKEYGNIVAGYLVLLQK